MSTLLERAEMIQKQIDNHERETKRLNYLVSEISKAKVKIESRYIPDYIFKELETKYMPVLQDVLDDSIKPIVSKLQEEIQLHEVAIHNLKLVP